MSKVVQDMENKYTPDVYEEVENIMVRVFGIEPDAVANKENEKIFMHTLNAVLHGRDEQGIVTCDDD